MLSPDCHCTSSALLLLFDLVLVAQAVERLLIALLGGGDAAVVVLQAPHLRRTLLLGDDDELAAELGNSLGVLGTEARLGEVTHALGLDRASADFTRTGLGGHSSPPVSQGEDPTARKEKAGERCASHRLS